MDATDPRHGTYAGYIAHRKDGEPKCEPCKVAGRRHHKRYNVLGSDMTTLGAEAHDLLMRLPRRIFTDAGLESSHVSRLKAGGPDARVRASTRERILRVNTTAIPTVDGMRRRLQALATLGWSAREISNRSGINVDNVSRLRRGDRTCYVRRETALRLMEVYRELSMTPAPPGRGPTWTRRDAKNRGWLPGLCWDEESIDDPAAKPVGRPTSRAHERGHDEYDEVVVERVLAGERLRTTRAEKAEIVRRWVAGGHGSAAEICRRNGWNDGRYKSEREAS